jgi:ribosomal protein L11 methyltransferase
MEDAGRPAIVRKDGKETSFLQQSTGNAAVSAQTIIPERFMLPFDSGHEILEPFIEHQGEKRAFWLRRPKTIGTRFLIARQGAVVPSRHRNRSVIFLTVDSAFGTGGHGTTEGCLIALERAIAGGETVLDVGTGTGILAIAAIKLGAARVVAVDIDRAACRETERNLAINGIGHGIAVMEGGVGSADGRFDVVVANLRTPVLLGLMGDLIGKLNPGGVAILSGITEKELHPLLSFLESYPLDTLNIQRVKGWMTVALKNEG